MMFILDFYRSVRRAVFLWGSRAAMSASRTCRRHFYSAPDEFGGACAALSASRKCRRHFYLGVWREGGYVYGRDPQPVHNGLGGLLKPRFCPRRSRGSPRGFERFKEMPKAFLHSHLAAASLRDSNTRPQGLKQSLGRICPRRRRGSPRGFERFKEMPKAFPPSS